MYAAQLDTRITIQRPETTRDEFGGVVEGWGLVTSTWASVGRSTAAKASAGMAMS